MKAYLIRAFTKNNHGGNMAGVVLDADDLSDKEMQDIATKINVSETAFVQKSDKADVKARFFTPISEVDLCGHATIATFSLLAKDFKQGIYNQETKAGMLKVEIESSGVIYMEQAKPSFYENIDSASIVKILNIPLEYINSTHLEPQIVSTGLRDVLVPIDTRMHVDEIKPNFSVMSQFSKDHNIVGLHVFTLDALDSNATAYVRNFAPLYGINEESATGTSNGALASYLYKNNKLIQTNNLIFEQGYSMNRPSEILSKIDTINGDMKVWVGGRAVVDKEIDLAN